MQNVRGQAHTPRKKLHGEVRGRKKNSCLYQITQPLPPPPSEVKWLAPKIHKPGKSNCTVTNSSHFVSAISHERIQENEVMVSFDVESLFTNVPI